MPLQYIEMAQRNRPFSNLSFTKPTDPSINGLDTYKQGYGFYLEKTFPHTLRQVNITTYKQAKEWGNIHKNLSINFKAQADQLNDAFRSGEHLHTFFETFEQYFATNHYNFQNANALKLTIDAFSNTVSDATQRRTKLFQAVQALNKLKISNNIWEAPEVLPIQNLSEVFLAYPVWYIQNKGGIYVRNQVVENCTGGLNNQIFNVLFNCYNSSSIHTVEFMREINDYEGEDVIPFDVIMNANTIYKLFDNVAIATPYHDVAQRQWNSTAFWQRNVDPVLLGFITGSPYFVVIRRWSATGVFPSTMEMIGDTLQHIKEVLIPAFKNRNQSFGGMDVVEKGIKNGNLLSLLKPA